MTSDRRRSELEGSQLCAASFYLVIIMTSNLLNLTHTTPLFLVMISKPVLDRR
jgi:hypothetical protein